MQGVWDLATVATLQNIQSLLLFLGLFFFWKKTPPDFSFARQMNHLENVCHGMNVVLCTRKQC